MERRRLRGILSTNSTTISSTAKCKVAHHQKPKEGRKSVQTAKGVNCIVSVSTWSMQMTERGSGFERSQTRDARELLV